MIEKISKMISNLKVLSKMNDIIDGLNTHTTNTNNPHNVTAEQLGLATAYVYKGSVENFSELPTDAQNGWVYSVENEYIDSSGNVHPAGSNFAWNGSRWDDLGGSLSRYTTLDFLEDRLAPITNQVNTNKTNIEDLQNDVDTLNMETIPTAVNKAETAATNAQNAATSVQKYKALWFDSVAAMKAEPSLTAGAYVCTAGYYEPNDGGGASYLIRAKADADIDDGGGLHYLSNDLVAKLIVENGTVNVKQFGAKGDGTVDDSNAIQQAVNSKYSSVYIPKGTYLISKTISVPTTLKTMRGEHSSTTIIKVEDIGFEFVSTNSNFALQHLKIIGNDKENAFGIKARFYSFYVLDVIIRDFSNGYGWYLSGNNEQGTVWSGMNVFIKCSAINCYYGIYVNSTPFNLNYFNNLFITSCQIGFTLNGSAENIAFDSCSFEQNDIVFQTLNVTNGTCYNCYFELNRIISTFGNAGYYGSDFLFYKCWFLCNNQKEIGWVCTVPMRSSNDNEQTVISYEKCKFVNYSTSTPKMFTFYDDTRNNNYLGISIKECSFGNNTPVYLDLFDLTFNPNYATYYDRIDINTDLPFYKQDGLVWYSVGGSTSYYATKTRKFRVYGKYVPTEATTKYLNITVPTNVTTYNASLLFAIVKYTDDTTDVLTGTAQTKLIQLSSLDTTKTVAYVLFDCEYGNLSMAS